MASTIKVNNIQNQCGANIVNKCSTTITLGASGDNITLACGATQSGFGRTGTVDWDTTAKTANFTAVSGNGYFVNTTSGAITVTLPAGSAGDIVSLADYAGTWQTNSVLIAPNGTDKIGGVNVSVGLSTEGQSVTFVYTDSTQGWLNTMDSTSNVRGSPYITATGGTITTCGNYKIHTFTGPGTFTVSGAGSGTPCAPSNADYLVIAGGGAGGGFRGGGGGAGGFRESCGGASGCYTTSPLAAPCGAITLTATAYPITVGAGGSGNFNTTGSSGSNSVFSTITSTGGGGGGTGSPSPSPNSHGLPGGSGGASGDSDGQGGYPTGSGNTPPVSPPQGNNSGNPATAPGTPFTGAGAGGGGAGATGGNSPGNLTAGNGGNGIATSISGSSVTRAGGGGGGSINGPTAVGCRSGTAGSGGSGGGGAGSATTTGTAGTTNTGSGGGGGGGNSTTCYTGTGGAGGSGIVIIRYKYQ